MIPDTQPNLDSAWLARRVRAWDSLTGPSMSKLIGNLRLAGCASQVRRLKNGESPDDVARSIAA